LALPKKVMRSRPVPVAISNSARIVPESRPQTPIQLGLNPDATAACVATKASSEPVDIRKATAEHAIARAATLTVQES
jgi:hypothetical protein